MHRKLGSLQLSMREGEDGEWSVGLRYTEVRGDGRNTKI
jgi:hypothetical protein